MKRKNIITVLLIVLIILLITGIISYIFKEDNLRVEIINPFTSTSQDNNINEVRKFVVNDKEGNKYKQVELIAILNQNYDNVKDLFGEVKYQGAVQGDESCDYYYQHEDIEIRTSREDGDIVLGFEVKKSNLSDCNKYLFNGVSLNLNNREIISKLGTPYSGDEFIFFYIGGQFIYPKGGIPSRGCMSQWLRFTANNDGSINTVDCYVAPDNTEGRGFSYRNKSKSIENKSSKSKIQSTTSQNIIYS